MKTRTVVLITVFLVQRLSNFLAMRMPEISCLRNGLKKWLLINFAPRARFSFGQPVPLDKGNGGSGNEIGS